MDTCFISYIQLSAKSMHWRQVALLHFSQIPHPYSYHVPYATSVLPVHMPSWSSPWDAQLLVLAQETHSKWSFSHLQSVQKILNIILQSFFLVKWLLRANTCDIVKGELMSRWKPYLQIVSLPNSLSIQTPSPPQVKSGFTWQASLLLLWNIGQCLQDRQKWGV